MNLTASHKPLTFRSTDRVTPAPEARHPFERAGFGPGPYTFIGQEESKYQACYGAPVQPGSSCDFCGTGIMEVYWFRSAARVVFKVGCDCMFKAARGSDDFALQTKAAALKRMHDRKLRHAREAVKADELRALLADTKAREVLAAMPHPSEYRAARGETLLDSVEWMAKNAGATGKIATLRTIKAALAQATPAADDWDGGQSAYARALEDQIAADPDQP